ncbi:Las1-like family protein [Cryptosporidium meleagridis]|uniref:Las1-like family protein n=1 Tax=Cryptosporidium meleagridis TaxID=93969 RepID=A0A2P4Z3W9_9CRYT|nr:Las1-like family protein [Cryptosporidium meleagridis]
MVFVINSSERSVPWYSKNEFFEVFSWITDSELNSKQLALNRLKIWEERSHGITKQCPIAIIGTSYILHTMLQDKIWDWSSISEGIKSESLNKSFKILSEKISNGEMKVYKNNIIDNNESLETYCLGIYFSVQNQYCMTITRIINLFVDQCQFQLYARSISSISAELGIPQILVEIRHQATHGSELPSLEVCRVGGILIFFYLISNYWKNQYDYLTHSIVVFNENICERFKQLIRLLSTMHFDWNTHYYLVDENLQRENETLLGSFNKYNEIYHNSLTKVVLEYISIEIPIRNKILKFFEKRSITKIKNERKDANKMIKILTKFEKFNNNSKIKLGKLKKWTKKFYSLLPLFYSLIEKIMKIIKNNDANESIIKDFIFNELMNICPLCCPISEIAVLFLLSLVSNNAKIEILSMIISILLENKNLSMSNHTIQDENKAFECKQDKKIRLFYWLRLLLPETKTSQKDKLLEGMNYNCVNNSRVIEVILLLTFYKRIEKYNNSKKIMNYEKIIEMLNSTKYSMLILFAELVSSIPDLIIKNQIKSNRFSLSIIHLLGDLKIFDSTSKLLHILIERNKEITSENLELLKNFLKFELEDYSSAHEHYFKKSNKVIVEDFGITPLLKIGTSWNSDSLKIIDHIYPFQNFIFTEESNQTNSDKEISDIDLIDNTIYYCDDTQPLKTKTLNMEYNYSTEEQNNLMNMCLLNAETFMRKNVGIKEMMNEKAINIDWTKVSSFSELSES